jgi:putative FmdB family regulatory protein
MKRLFDYECTEGHKFELLVEYAFSNAQYCPECGAEALKLLTYSGSYVIRGNNSASQTPKRLRSAGDE